MLVVLGGKVGEVFILIEGGEIGFCGRVRNDYKFFGFCLLRSGFVILFFNFSLVLLFLGL